VKRVDDDDDDYSCSSPADRSRTGHIVVVLRPVVVELVVCYTVRQLLGTCSLKIH